MPSSYNIGETSRKLSERFVEHLRDIRNNKGTSVSDHFRQPSHGLDDPVIHALLSAPLEEPNRLELENRIIFHFRSFQPPGLNRDFTFLTSNS